MKLCSAHHNELYAKVKEAGLLSFCARDDGKARERVMNRNNPRVFPQDRYEPLMASVFSICANATQSGGLSPNADCCPLCELNAHYFAVGGGETPRDWINKAVAEQVKIGRDLQLLPRPN